MQVWIEAAEGGASADLEEFYGWLIQTREVSRVAQVGRERRGPAGAMSVGDVITMSTEVGGAFAALVGAFAAWRQARATARTPAPPLSITVQSGATIILHTGSPQESAALLAAVATSAPAGTDTGIPPAAGGPQRAATAPDPDSGFRPVA